MDSTLKNLMFWSCLMECIPAIFIAFGVQYSEVYIIKRINEEQYAIKTIIANMLGVVAYWLISKGIVLDFLRKYIKGFLLIVMVLYMVGHILIPGYPWYALLVITMNSSLIKKINDVVFDDLHNEIFIKRDKTILNAKRKMWSMLGVMIGSGLTLIVMKMTIEQIVYIALVGDILMFIMSMIMYWKIKKIIG